jgi:hypothetical protein
MHKHLLTALLAIIVISGVSAAHAAPAKPRMKVTQVQALKRAPQAAPTRSGRPLTAEQQRKYAAAKRARDNALKIANQEFLAAIARAGASGESIIRTKKVPTPTATAAP